MPQYNHGVDIEVAAIGRQPVPFSDISTVGVIGTAPQAQGDFQAGGSIRHDEPFHFTSLVDAKDLIAGAGAEKGTLYPALQAIYAQGDVNVIALIAEANVTEATERQNFIGDAGLLTGVHAFLKAEAKYGIEPRILCAPTDRINSRYTKPAITGAAFTIAYAEGEVWTVEPTVTFGEPGAWRYDHANGRKFYFDGNTGTLRLPAQTGFNVNLSAPTGANGGSNIIVTDVKYQYTVDGGTNWVDYASSGSGGTVIPGGVAVQVTLTASATPVALTSGAVVLFRFVVTAGSGADEVSISPTAGDTTFTLSATFDATFTGETANGLALSLLSVAEQLRAVALIDGPNVYADIARYVEDFDDSRAYIIAPKVKDVSGDDAFASAYAAGVIAVNDANKGYWYSPSNTVLKGVSGQSIPIDFKMGSQASRAAVLNNLNTTTVIRKNGFKLWGNRLVTTTPGLSFITARRIIDLIVDSLQNALFNQVDRPLTKDLVDGVADTVNAFLRGQEARGAIAGGECFPNPDLNTTTALANGEVNFSIKVSPTPPAESINLKLLITNEYLQEIFV